MLYAMLRNPSFTSALLIPMDLRMRFPALSVCLGWLGLSMLDTMVYMRDAPVLKLRLTSPFSGAPMKTSAEKPPDWAWQREK